MRKKILSVLMIAVFLLTGMLSIPAFAAGETISIGSGDALLAVISATSGTAGNVYELTADVSVSTASLSPDARTFEGEFKGNGHTITVTDATAQPLFGTIGDGAQVKNVTVAFQHNVLGATLANKVGSATIDGATVTFAGDVLFASTSVGEQAFSYACGLFGTKTGTSNQPTYIKNVSIAGNGRIGSTTAVGGRGVCASGVYAETSADGMNDAVLDHVTVTVGSIYAVTSADEYQAFCNAAGAVAGAYYGYKANCGYVTVNVTGNIHASATNDAGADVDAYGLAYAVQSLYSCQINVGGNIEAYGTGHDYWPDYSGNIGTSPTTDGAYGIAHYSGVSNNQTYFHATGVGNTAVNVQGNIVVRTDDVKGRGLPYYAEASGIGHESEFTVPWQNVSVEVGNIQAELPSGYAFATGFSFYNQMDHNWQTANCSVTADEISAKGYLAFASGFGYLLDYTTHATSTNDSVQAGTVQAESDYGAYAGGFAVQLKECDVTGATVDVDSILIDGPGEVGGFAAEVDGEAGTIQNCTVTTNEISAGGATDADGLALFLAGNAVSYQLHNNTVNIPKTKVGFFTADGKDDWVHFTYSEQAGQADDEAWESGNTLVLTDTGKVYDLDCAYDDSSEHKTLWGIQERVLSNPAIAGATVTVNESLGLNVYVSLPEGFTQGDLGKMTFTMDGETQTVTAKKQKEVSGITYYAYTLPVAAPHMADQVTATLYASDNTTAYDTKTLSVKEYGTQVVKKTTTDSADFSDTAKAMLNYGAAAQQHFNHNTDNLANSALNPADQAVANMTGINFETRMGEAEGVDYDSIQTSLVLGDTVSMKVYFSLSGKEIGSYAFTNGTNGQAMTPVSEGNGKYSLTVSGIYTNNLTKEFPIDVSVDGGKKELFLVTSPLAYFKAVEESGDAGTLGNLVKALYQYAVKAAAYTEAHPNHNYNAQ